MMYRRFVTLLISAGLLPGALMAQTTPNHVFQNVQYIERALDLMHDANYSEASEAQQEATARRPRHVIQVANTVFRKVQLLRFINGFETRSLPPIPAREVTPADVDNIVSQIRADLEEMYAAFGITPPALDIELPEGRTPTDVFNGLLQVEAALDGLGLPRAVPNDVFRATQTLISELELLLAHVTPGRAMPPPAGWTPASPAAAYQEATELLGDIATLVSENPELEIPGGVVMPTERSGDIRPSDVLFMVNIALAEISALKVMYGLETPMHLAPVQSGRTPADVLQDLVRARTILSMLRTPERSPS